MAVLRLHQEPHPFLPRTGNGPPAVQEAVGPQRGRPARVPAGDLRRPHLPAGRQRGTDRRGQAHRPHDVDPPSRRAVGLESRGHLQHRLRHAPRRRPLGRPGAGGGGQLHRRRHPLVATVAERQRVLTAAGPGTGVLRFPERDRLRPRRPQRSRRLDLPCGRLGEGESQPLRRGPVLRRLLRPGPGDLRADRPPAVAQRIRRCPVGQRDLLLHRRGRVRARVPGQHRRSHVRLRRPHGEARLGRPDGRLRVRVPGRHGRPRARPDGLLRLLRRQLLRAQRPHRADRVALRRGRQDLRLGHHHRPHRLPRRPRPAPHLRARDLNRPQDLRNGHRRLRPGRQRRPRRVPDRLLGPVRAGTPGGCRGRRPEAELDRAPRRARTDSPRPYRPARLRAPASARSSPSRPRSPARRA